MPFDTDDFTPTVEAAAAFETERGRDDYDDRYEDALAECNRSTRRRYTAGVVVDDFAPARLTLPF